MKKDTLKKRYFFKLLSNGVNMVCGFFTYTVVMRALGPRAYGDFTFITNFFNQLIVFFDMGSSTGFFVKLSQRQKESKLVLFYFYFIAIVAASNMLFVVAVQSAGVNNIFWPNQAVFYVYLALFLGIFTWVINVFSGMTDAYGLTASAEIVKVFQKIFGLIVLVFLFILNKLSFKTFFYYNYFIIAVLLVAIYLLFKNNGLDLFRQLRLSLFEFRKYFKEFYAYSHPFLLYSLIGLIAGLFDRWLLQIFSGSIQQGFFGLSYQLGAICFMFTSAMTPLIMREFSIAFANNDLGLMSRLFRKHLPFLYSITVLLACFIVINADKVVLIMGGGRFQGAALAVAVMAFYPVHQAYGQLSGSVFYASGRTKLYCNIGIVFMLVSLPVTYFMIAPRTMHGLALGSTGLAAKMVLIQFLTVNVQLFFNSRMLGLVFWKYLAHQLASIAGFLILASFSKIIAVHLLGLQAGMILSLVCSGAIYLVMVLIFIYFVPIIIGTKREDLSSYIKSFEDRIRMI